MSTATATVPVTPLQLARYLGTALKQRERAAQKFISDYGPQSATVQEITAEIATLRRIINDLEAPPLPVPELIKAAAAKK